MGEKGGERRDETRATFAPVHRPRPAQIVKSCLQLSEILIFSDESFSSCLSSLSFSSSRSTRSRSSIIFRQITIFSSKRESRKVYSSHSPFHVTIASTCRNFAGSLKSFRAIPGSWPRLSLLLRVKPRIPYRGYVSFPVTMISRKV